VDAPSKIATQPSQQLAVLGTVFPLSAIRLATPPVHSALHSAPPRSSLTIEQIMTIELRI
jgi:hypothetical protein